MKDKPTIYIKLDGKPIIPVTVQIYWHTNGKIRPLMYWMPDNSCYEVKHVYEATKLAFLKDRGEGIRFKIKAEPTNASDPDRESPLYTRDDVYLYLADNRFCEKDFIDQRYGHTNKEYIPVTLDIFPNGDYELIYFSVGDKRYMVEKTLDIQPRGSFFAGGIGIWHKVEARLVNADNDEDPSFYNSVCRQAALYWELNKWFVAIKP